MPADRTPFFCGILPVAIAAQTASADVGWMVAMWRAPRRRRGCGRNSATSLRRGARNEVQRGRIDRDHGDPPRPVVQRHVHRRVGGASASSTSGVPPPRSASGATTDPTAIATQQRGPHRRAARAIDDAALRPRHRHRSAAAARITTLRFAARGRAGIEHAAKGGEVPPHQRRARGS